MRSIGCLSSLCVSLILSLVSAGACTGVGKSFPWEAKEASQWAQGTIRTFPTPSKRPPQDRYFSLPRGRGPYVAMTFDDGPRPWTNTLLDELAKRQIKGTFFIVGQEAKNYTKIVKRMAAEGHEIANHTWTHNEHMDRMPLSFVRRELQMAHDFIVKTTGIEPRVMRPPGGNFSTAQTRWMADEFGYTDIRWNVDPGDAQIPRPSLATFRRRIVGNTREGSIILSHDLQKASVEALPGTLDELLKKGFQFLTVSQLLALDEPGAELMILPAELDSALSESASGQ